MSATKKGIISFVLLLAVAGIYYTQTGSNENLFQGQLLGNDDPEQETEELNESNARPDLTADLEVSTPASEEEDIEFTVTISNLGSGDVTGETSFEYTLYLNDEEIFSNSDSYTFMEPGDSFSFTYPVSRLIYEYENTGTARVTVDTTNNIAEENEENNSVQIEF